MLVRGMTVAMPLAGTIDIAAEKARLTKEISKLDGEAKKIEAKLGNADFLTRAKEGVFVERAGFEIGHEPRDRDRQA